MTTPITIVGGGIAGLTAAVTVAEAGVPVRLYEAHSVLGGRARTAAGPYRTNNGTHTFYADGAPWEWLAERGFVTPYVRLGLREIMRMRFWRGGKIRTMVSRDYSRMVVRGRRLTAPVDRSFADWGGEHFGEAAVREAAGFLGPALYDADPGRLSAAFVFERLLRVGRPRYPLPTRYPIGGWGAVIDRMSARAQELGAVIETGARVHELPDDGPVVVAASMAASRALLRDESLAEESGAAVMLDVGLTSRRGDRLILFDLDEGGFVGRYTSHDPSLAPAGESLFQSSLPVRSGESKSAALSRIEALQDLAAPGWRDRVTWRKDYVSRGRTGALDLPGRTWRDRPAIDRGGGVFLCGDGVAAPGVLVEVSVNSALTASRLAVEAVSRNRA
ncbi:phytoene desaturase family protein [Nocardiopsis oceani]